ncbi:PREDICTED: uncharacterized protein LOC104753323 [Camelina sativa]|uniref:Uncharacterized protein LOC104753323 n=1 Tax=Camelina sativa TaxID=90675 RepID=A0ABM1R2I3_CAMSA|nr:PREDICTED: uncharacterized protein LOC104753323 [Camelina sativa]
MEYWKAYRTLRHARQLVRGSLESGYMQLNTYLYMLKRANSGTYTQLELDDADRFNYLFLAYGVSLNGFPFMRKVLVVDGTFLQGKYKGTLLTATSQDGNFQIFQIAWAVVDTENDESWDWFFKQLGCVISNDEGLAIIYDRHKSIGKAIKEVYSKSSRGICTYHLYKNILVRFKGWEAFGLVKKAASAYRVVDFQSIFDQIEALNPALHDYLVQADVRLWTRAHFPGDRYNLLTSNIAESMNTSRVEYAKLLTVQDIDANQVQVTSGSSLHVVNLKYRRCTCRRFDLEKLPCAHAIAACEKRKTSRIRMCHPYFRRIYLCDSYATAIMPRDFGTPVPEQVASKVALPPIPKNKPGRPKNLRMKSALEIAMKRKKPRKQYTCGNCNQVGHNRKTCNN